MVRVRVGFKIRIVNIYACIVSSLCLCAPTKVRIFIYSPEPPLWPFFNMQQIPIADVWPG